MMINNTNTDVSFRGPLCNSDGKPDECHTANATDNK